MKNWMLAFMLLGFCSVSFAQVDSTNNDTSSPTLKEKKRNFMGGLFKEPPNMNPSPKKAMLLSFAFPGAGQIYNKQYVKVPFVWAAVGGAGYWIYYNRTEYVCFRDIVRAREINEVAECDVYTNVSTNAIIDARDKAQKRMESSYFIFLGVYLLNGLESFTAAHLLNFDISDDLSLKISPHYDWTPTNPVQQQQQIGFKGVFTF